MAERKFDVAVVGELNPDLILSGNVIPEFGQGEQLVNQADLTIGSSSAIFACGAARLGLRVAFIGKVGNDLFGKYICQSLDEHGIDTSGILMENAIPTGISVILSTGNDRAILTYPGTIPRLEYTEINLDLIKQARHLHIGSYFLLNALRPGFSRLFDFAHGYGVSISLDPNFDPTGNWDRELPGLLYKVDVFLPNELECLKIAGASDLESALLFYTKRIPFLGLKLGKKGALLCQGSKRYQVGAILVDSVDTVGAGDSFDAGFVYGYLAGWESLQILKFANICGGLSTRLAGGTSAQPALEEAMSYL